MEQSLRALGSLCIDYLRFLMSLHVRQPVGTPQLASVVAPIALGCSFSFQKTNEHELSLSGERQVAARRREVYADAFGRHLVHCCGTRLAPERSARGAPRLRNALGRLLEAHGPTLLENLRSVG